MSQLGIIIKNEYLTDIRTKSFWIGTFVLPALSILFGIFMGFMMSESDVMRKTSTPVVSPDEISGMQVLGMLMGIFLAVFLMIYGSQIFNKVKKEKCNRIVEILATSVSGRTMMLGKIISVALVGFTQIVLWIASIAVIFYFFVVVFSPEIPWNEFLDARIPMAFLWCVLFFIGGYVFYGSLYAACGAMTDRDNENQTYMTAITFVLLSSFYIGQFAVTNASNIFVTICSFIPLTSPVIGCVNAISGEVPLYQSVLSLVSLYAFAVLAVAFAGKIYTSSILLKGKKLTPSDIILFFKMK